MRAIWFASPWRSRKLQPRERGRPRTAGGCSRRFCPSRPSSTAAADLYCWGAGASWARLDRLISSRRTILARCSRRCCHRSQSGSKFGALSHRSGRWAAAVESLPTPNMDRKPSPTGQRESESCSRSVERAYSTTVAASGAIASWLAPRKRENETSTISTSFLHSRPRTPLYRQAVGVLATPGHG